jgi:hypothetical protein
MIFFCSPHSEVPKKAKEISESATYHAKYDIGINHPTIRVPISSGIL